MKCFFNISILIIRMIIMIIIIISFLILTIRNNIHDGNVKKNSNNDTINNDSNNNYASNNRNLIILSAYIMVARIIKFRCLRRQRLTMSDAAFTHRLGCVVPRQEPSPRVPRRRQTDRPLKQHQSNGNYCI